MIDKRTLNNEIVSMRKVVKQAKVHIISKLSREIKNLRKKEGPEELKSKCNRKADRKRDEIFAIKKLKIDDVSKFALKNLEDPAKKIGDQGVNLELRGYFRFAATKVLSAKVTAFREQYPDWKDYIHDLLDELGGRRKNSNQPSKVAKVGNTAKNIPVANNPEGRKNSRKEEKPLVSEQKDEDEQVNVLQNKMNGELVITGSPTAIVKKAKFLSSQWSVEEIEPVAVSASHLTLQKQDGSNYVKCNKTTQNIAAVRSTLKGDHRFSSSLKKSIGVAEVKRFHELCDSQESVPRERSSNLKLDEGNSDDDEESGDADVEKAVDPFFVKADGKTEYVTKMVVEEEEEDEKDDSLSRGGGKKLRGGQQWKGAGWGGKEGGRDSRGGGRGFRGGRGSFGDRGQPRRGRGGGQGRGGGNPWSEQNRGGHDQGSRFAGRGDSVRGNGKFSKKNQPVPAESGGAHLHPSWEAKRKLKEQSISNIAFQGKKIKFDDD